MHVVTDENKFIISARVVHVNRMHGRYSGRCNAPSRHHQYEHVQFVIHFITELKKNVCLCVVELPMHLEVLRTPEKCKNDLPVASTSLVFLECPKNFPCTYIVQQFLSLNTCIG